MDLQDWEILPDEGFLEIHDDGGGSKVYSRRKSSSNKDVFQMNYFVCPPVVLEPIIPPKPQDDDQELLEKNPIEINTCMPPATDLKMKSFDQDNVSLQVFFKKRKDTEFADMKVESPNSNSSNSSSSRGNMAPPQIEQVFQYEEKEDDPAAAADDDDDLNIWKWSLPGGIGAICSFGIAVCIIILNRKNKHPKQNHKFQFQIETNDKRIRQVVEHASKLNEAISAVSGFPVNRAQITFGGYYDAAAAAI
ncbi:hypothetical protein ACJIZ3_025889 [Penstemon smallii]|uniref:DUF6821 domain-containing protein n=1 Tax=Penstemon smallii TaxID=265156 RepID=A0ABD3TY39_9LAMI